MSVIVEWASVDGDMIQRVLQEAFEFTESVSVRANVISLQLSVLDKIRFRDRGCWAIVISTSQCNFLTPDSDIPAFVASHESEHGVLTWVYGVYSKAISGSARAPQDSTQN